jgi:putative acetyltransferase
VKLRRAGLADAPAIAALHRLTMRTNLPFVPDIHTLDEEAAFFGGRFLAENEAWVAEHDGRLAGYVAFSADWVNHLYVHPDWQGQGVGPQLLAIALADGQPKQLWAFAENARARRFYEKRGWLAVEFGDGTGNAEGQPDVRYAWTSPQRG